MLSMARSPSSTEDPLVTPRLSLSSLPVEIKLMIAALLDIGTAKAVARTSKALQDIGECKVWRVLKCALPESVSRARHGKKDKGPLIPKQLASICSARLLALSRRPIRRQAVVDIHFSVCRGILDSQKAAQRRIVLLVGSTRLEAIRYHWVPRWMPAAFKSVDTLDLTIVLQRDLGTLVFPKVTTLSLPRLPRDTYDFDREDRANRPVLHLLHCFPRLRRVVRPDIGAPRKVVQVESVRARPVYAMELARPGRYSYNRAMLQPAPAASAAPTAQG